MKTSVLRQARAVLIVTAVTSVIWVNAGSLTPPGGPVAPTMKTLDQVEPAIPIQSLSGSATATIAINSPGSYYLTGDLQGLPAKHGILVESDNVSIDLHGYSVIGTGSGSGSFDGIGIGLATQRRNISIVNGIVRNWGRDGVNGIFGGSNCVFRDLRLSDNGRNGLTVQAGSVTNCAAQNNPSSGFVTYEGTSITNCAAWGNGTGFSCNYGSIIANCAARSNIAGISLGEGAIATNCIISSNTGSGLQMSTATVALNNQIDGNGKHGIETVFGPSAGRIEGNTITRSTNAGINLTGATNFIVVRNTARSNGGGNYVTVAGNSWGPIVNVAGVGDVSGTPNANHALANLSY